MVLFIIIIVLSSSSHCFRALVACQISIIIVSSISCITHHLIGFGQHRASGSHPMCFHPSIASLSVPTSECSSASPFIYNSTSNALPFNMLAFDLAQHNSCNCGTHRSLQLSLSLLYIAAKDLRASKPQKKEIIYIFWLYTTLGFSRSMKYTAYQCKLCKATPKDIIVYT